LERFVLEEEYKTLHEEGRKGKWQQGIESPYIHNCFFLPRDETITMNSSPKP
jgi:hypothetical protein